MQATRAVCSLSHRERGGVRGYALSILSRPLTPALSPLGRGSHTARVAPAALVRTVGTTTFAMLVSLALIIAAMAESAPTPEQIDQGREIYEDNCQTCHGRDMVSPGAVVFDLRKFPKDDANRFRASVLKGKGTAMPAFDGRLSGEDVDLLWAYVRGGP